MDLLLSFEKSSDIAFVRPQSQHWSESTPLRSYHSQAFRDGWQRSLPQKEIRERASSLVDYNPAALHTHATV